MWREGRVISVYKGDVWREGRIISVCKGDMWREGQPAASAGMRVRISIGA